MMENKVNKILPILILPLFFLISSCGNETVHEEFREFENMGWNRFDDQDFEFEVESTSGSYDVKLALVFKESFSHNTFTFDTRITTPGGEERAMNHKLHFNKIDESTPEAAPDNSKTGYVYILKDYKFDETGTAKVKVQNRMRKTRTPGMLEIGLLVEKH